MHKLRHRLLIHLIRHHRDIYFKLIKIAGLNLTRDDAFWSLHVQLLEDARGIQTLQERHNLWSLAKETTRLKGDLAEVGVYRGGSAKILCEVKGEANLYLFDTFTGLPSVDKKSDGIFNEGDFDDTSMGDVRKYLRRHPNVFLFKGLFPASAAGLEPEKREYKFVHLDVDLYESTLACLKFFYPRMVRGGILISHDYNRIDAPGVHKAFTEFMADKPETLIPLWHTQVVLVKI
jgi:hypothetical protein